MQKMKRKLICATISGCLIFGATPAFAADEPPMANNPTGTWAFTKDVPNAFNLEYKEQWAAYGCTKDGWEKIVRGYNDTMGRYKAQSHVLDQQTFDVIKNPNQIKIKGFEYLGCDLSASLGSLKEIANGIQDILAAISSGSIKDKIAQGLERIAREQLKSLIKRAEEAACKAVNKAIDDKTAFIRNNAQDMISYVNNFDKMVADAEAKALEDLAKKAQQ